MRATAAVACLAALAAAQPAFAATNDTTTVVTPTVNGKTRSATGVTNTETNIAGTGTYLDGTSIVTSPNAVFVDADLGASIAGPGIPAGTTIVDVLSATTVRVSAYVTASGPTTLTIGAKLKGPQCVAKDAAVGLYMADTENHRVLYMNQSAVTVSRQGVSIAAGATGVVAGIGNRGDSGDGGPATLAQLARPLCVALDPVFVAGTELGYLYISDSANNRVRRVDAKGIITTYAGIGQSGCPQPDLTQECMTVDAPALASVLTYPAGLAFDNAHNLYIADFFDNRVRKVAPAPAGPGGVLGGLMTTVAGKFNCRRLLEKVPGIVEVEEVRAYLDFAVGTVSDTACPEVDPASTPPNGDGGAASASRLSYPIGVAWHQNVLYIVEQGGNRVRAVKLGSLSPTVLNVTIADGNIDTVAGNGSPGSTGDGGAATLAKLGAPYTVALTGATGSSLTMYISDDANNKIRKVVNGGIISTSAGTGTGGFDCTTEPCDITVKQLKGPRGLALDTSGTPVYLYVGDSLNNRIRKIEL